MSDQVRYSMDAAQSQFTVHAFASGLAAVVAHNPKFAIRDFKGEAEFASNTLQDVSLRMSTIEARSIASCFTRSWKIEVSGNHL